MSLQDSAASEIRYDEPGGRRSQNDPWRPRQILLELLGGKELPFGQQTRERRNHMILGARKCHALLSFPSIFDFITTLK